jgi:Tfp pilus assembly protein PilF
VWRDVGSGRTTTSLRRALMGRTTRGSWPIVSLALLATAAACATTRGPHQRDLESLAVVDGEVVRASRPSSTAYALYLEAKLAMERQPPDLEQAAAAIDDAISYDPKDPGLWCVLAEIAGRRGDEARRREAQLEIEALAPGWSCPDSDPQSQLAR